MEFWGVEVKAGEPVKIRPSLYKIIHVSQAALGEVKDFKGSISVPLRLKIGDKQYVIGNLSNDDRPQLMLDLVFEKPFELSHDWKNGSVYFVGDISDDPCGYPFISTASEDDSDEDLSSDEEGHQLNGIQGKLRPKAEDNSDINSDDAGDSDASDDDSTDILLENGSEPSIMDDTDASDEDYSSDDTPSKDKVTKKRTLESAAEIPAAAKEAKLSIPEKKGGKNGQFGKAPSPGNKSKGQTPKSGGNGNFSGKPSNKPFGKKAKQGRK